MAPYRGWASSFLATTLVVTSTAMESPSWPPASRPTAASTDGAHAIFLYPTGSPTINVIDTIEVTYDTVWTTTNLTLMCEIDPVGNVWSTTELDLIPPDGSVAIIPADTELGLTDFPTPCRILLRDSNDNADVYTGAEFTMTSTQGAPSLYALAQTYLISPTTTAGANGAYETNSASASRGSSISISATASSPSSPTASSSSSTGTAIAAGSSSPTSGLSNGAKAGIAIAVIACAVFLAAGVFFFMRSRKNRTTAAAGERINSTTTAGAGEGSFEKYGEGLPPAPVVGVDLVVPPTLATTTNRSSEDWRRFFGNASSRALEK